MTYNRNGAGTYGKSSGGTGGADAYAKTSVSTTTNQKDLIVMAYDGILKFLRLGREHALAKEYEKKHINYCKARAILEELASTLNMDKGGTIAKNLWNIYVFCMERISTANITNDVKYIDEILPVIEDFRNTWAELEIPKDDAEIQALNKRSATNTSGHWSIRG